MAENLDLTGETIAATYTQLLHIGKTEGIEGAGTGHFITDANGTESVLSLDAGYVGIGTESPTALLTVGAINTLLTDGTTAVTPEGMNLHITEASKYAMGIKNADASGDGLIIQAGDAADDFALRVEDYDSANDLFVVQGGGNVGIGTAAPKGILDINTTGITLTAANLANESISFGELSGTYPTIAGKNTADNQIGLYLLSLTKDTNSGADMTLAVYEQDGTDFSTLTTPAFKFARYATDLVTILRNGKVGIGVADPDASLEVAGTGYAWVGQDTNCIWGKEAGANLHANSQYNTAIGYQALDYDSCTGTYNCAVGVSALTACTTGGSNTAIGPGAGDGITTGASNTFAGYAAGRAVTEGAYNICIGQQSDAEPDQSYQIAIGKGAVVGAVYGIAIGEGVTSATNIITVGKSGATNSWWLGFTTGTTWAQSSDLRMKRNIKDDTLGLSFINDLKTKTFQWKPTEEFPVEWEDWSFDDDGNKVYADVYDGVMHGMIAQDVKEALDKAGVDTFGAWAEDEKGAQSLASGDFVYPLIKAVQELSAKVSALENA